MGPRFFATDRPKRRCGAWAVPGGGSARSTWTTRSCCSDNRQHTWRRGCLPRQSDADFRAMSGTSVNMRNGSLVSLVVVALLALYHLFGGHGTPGNDLGALERRISVLEASIDRKTLELESAKLISSHVIDVVKDDLKASYGLAEQGELLIKIADEVKRLRKVQAGALKRARSARSGVGGAPGAHGERATQPCSCASFGRKGTALAHPDPPVSFPAMVCACACAHARTRRAGARRASCAAPRSSRGGTQTFCGPYVCCGRPGAARTRVPQGLRRRPKPCRGQGNHPTGSSHRTPDQSFRSSRRCVSLIQRCTTKRQAKLRGSAHLSPSSTSTRAKVGVLGTFSTGTHFWGPTGQPPLDAEGNLLQPAAHGAELCRGRSVVASV